MTRSTRAVNLFDARALRRLPLTPVGGSIGALEHSCSLSPLALLVAAVGCGGHRLFLTRDGGRVEGVLHLVARGRSQRWEALGTYGDTCDADWLPDALVAATAAAAIAGVGKLVARLEHGDARLPDFEDAGFRPYTQETVFAAPLAPTPPDRDGLNLRPFGRRDEGPVRRLFCTMTPPNVQAMEVATNREFFAPFAHGPGVVVERGGELLAAVGVAPCRSPDAALLSLVIRMDAVAAGEVALLTVMSRLARRGVRTAWLPLRDYLADGHVAARLAGFTDVFTRTALVKHTQALIRPPVFSRLRESPGSLPAVNGTRLVHSGVHAPQCRLRNDPRARRREAPVSVT